MKHQTINGHHNQQPIHDTEPLVLLPDPYSNPQWREISLYHLWQIWDLPTTHSANADYLAVSHA